MVSLKHVNPGSSTTEVLHLGPLTVRVLSSGPHTSTIILTIAPHTPGFPLHFHCMHQVNFFALRGTVRFVSSGPPANSSRFNIKPGDYIEVPVGARYGFSNPFAREAELFVTYAPGYYVECLRALATLCEGRNVLTVEEQEQAVLQWATIIVAEGDRGDDMDEDDEDDEGGPRYTGLRCMA